VTANAICGEFLDAWVVEALCERFPHCASEIRALIDQIERNPDPVAHGGLQIPNNVYPHVYEFVIGDDDAPEASFAISFPARVDAFGTKWLCVVSPTDLQ
jgi:hypothetical protein